MMPPALTHPKPRPGQIAPDAPPPAAALLTRATAPNVMAQPQQARVTFRLTESEAGKFGLLDRYRAAIRRREDRESKKRLALEDLNASISSLLARAQAEQWSQRRLAAKIAIPETTLRRIRDQKVNPLVWLPRIQSAMHRLTPC